MKTSEVPRSKPTALVKPTCAQITPDQSRECALCGVALNRR